MSARGASIDELIARDPYLTSLGLHQLVGDDSVVVVLPPLERHVAVPDAGVVHGGVIAAFLEAAAALHLRSTGLDGVRTVEFSTDFLRAVPLEATYAQAALLRNGRRFASVRVDAWQADRHRLVAAGHGRFVVAAAS